MISACQGEGLGRIHSGASRCVHKGGAPGFPSHVQHPEPGPAAKSQMKRVAVHILTDCRQCLEDWVPYGTASSAGSASALDSPESDLWRALSDGVTAWETRPTPGGQSSFWRRLIVIARATRSQFDALHEALANGLSLDGPTAAVALDGRGFRGQRGRQWATAPGNLYLTVVVPMNAPASDVVAGLTMLPAVAVVDAIRGCGADEARPTIKWVNDILIHGRKVGGVLTSTVCRGGLIESAVIGIGVNVSRAPRVEPTPFVPRVGCLREFCGDVGLGPFTWGVLESIAKWYHALFDGNCEVLLRAYIEASCVVGSPVRVRVGLF